MSKKFFVPLVLFVGMATPALAEGTRTIQVWGANVDVPKAWSQPYVPPADRAQRSPLRWANIRPSKQYSATTSDVSLSRGDEDGDNAKNPALPGYERGRGQETGGPARQLIPD
ncbi:hypothetical protein [Methylobacterium sp. CM6247]